jgi:hypothetical protein
MTSLFDLNNVTISGNLTREPQLRHTAAGTAVCNIRIAHNERRKTTGGEWIDTAVLRRHDLDQPRRMDDPPVAQGRQGRHQRPAALERIPGCRRQTREAVDINANSLIHVGRRETIQASEDSDEEPALSRADDGIPF